MKILIVSWEYPPVVVGGLGRHVHHLATELAAAGHEVLPVTIERGGAWVFDGGELTLRPGGGLLRVAAHRDGVWVALNVSDSGVGFRATSGRGLGLANLRARILGLYGGEASLRLTGAAEGGVMATMRLPFGPPPEAAVA